jgi:hypothetical protein
MIVERKLRRRQLADDGNVEITGRDLCEREPRTMPLFEEDGSLARGL